MGLPAVTVGVNISPMQFRRLGLLEEVKSVMEQTGLSPCRLNLELTEGVVMHQADTTIATLQALKEMGVQISIDDFGTGYSSLAYLKAFPIDSLKIDQTFITDLGHNPNDLAIVEAIIGMGHTLGLKIVAEGVSNEHQLTHLQKLGCDEFQGHYFSPPLEADAMARLLAQQMALADSSV